MKILLVDDEVPARELIKKYLEDVDTIVSLEEATNGFDALKLISKSNFDVVLLDIQMPKLNGFEMLELIDNPPPIIFCTAYDEFAIKAFEQQAIDYLLKPFSKARLFEALDKLKNRSNSNNFLINTALRLTQPLERIVVKNGKSIDIIPVDEIQYLMSQDDYVEIHSNGKKYLKQARLKYYESVLNTKLFVRVHRQYIVNIKCIAKLDKFGKESHIALLKGGDTITISAAGYQNLKEVLAL